MKKLVCCLLVSLLISLTFGKEYIWQWHRVDCTYKHNIESLFEHCSPMEQEFIEEARKECGEDNWIKLQKWIACGAPQRVIIKAKDIQEAYKTYTQYVGEEWLLEKLPLQNFKQDIDDNLVIQYIWKGDTYLETYFGFDMKTQCNYVYFSDMGDGDIAIVKGSDTTCERNLS